MKQTRARIHRGDTRSEDKLLSVLRLFGRPSTLVPAKIYPASGMTNAGRPASTFSQWHCAVSLSSLLALALLPLLSRLGPLRALCLVWLATLTRFAWLSC